MIAAILLSPQISSNPYDGYVDHWGNEVPGLITNDFWMTSMPEYVKGKMVFYGPYAMDATAEYRGIEYDDCIGGVSLMSPKDIGRKAWIAVDGEWYGPFCVVDCARRGDMYSVVVYREEVIEANFDFAEQMGMVTRINESDYTVNNWYLDVEVFLPPADRQKMKPVGFGTPINYRDWFLEHVEFASCYQPEIITLRNFEWKEYGTTKRWTSYYSDFPVKSVAGDFQR
jgi:hypothetical protein